MRGGTLIVGGDAGARCAVAMKGGTHGSRRRCWCDDRLHDAKGVLVVGGDAGDALGDSLYEGKIYVRGHIESLGSDAHIVEMSEDDAQMLLRVLDSCDVPSLRARTSRLSKKWNRPSDFTTSTPKKKKSGKARCNRESTSDTSTGAKMSVLIPSVTPVLPWF
jgi:glutamate synthase domain-containing protein 3